MAFDREGLQAFVDGGDKSPPPVFVGRAELLKDIEGKASLAWRGAGAAAHGIPGVTRIIQGAPGAGKSSLLDRLETRSLEARAMTKGGEEPRVLFLTSEMLEESVSRILGLLREAGRLAQHEWLERGRDLLGRAARRVEAVSAAGVDVDLSRTELGGLLALREALPPERWARPVIVAIDEAQNIRPDKHAPPALFLQGIHNGRTGLPLTLVLAGLGDTADRATKLGLTRGTVIHGIGSLAAEEVSSFMEESCRHFGMDPGGYVERLDALANPCEGWPRHLHFALQALGRAALAVNGNLGVVDWQAVVREAEGSRLNYYRDQQSEEMEDAAGLVAAVLRSLDGNSGTVGVMGSIGRNVRAEEGWRLPEGMTARSFLSHLIHRGALHRHADKTITCPIPSFRTFLIKKGSSEAEVRHPCAF